MPQVNCLSFYQKHPFHRYHTFSATVFLVCSAKIGEQSQELMTRQLQHEDANERIDAILRFGVLWRFRWHVWPRLEDGAHMHIKVRFLVNSLWFLYGLVFNVCKGRGSSSIFLGVIFSVPPCNMLIYPAYMFF